MPDISAPLPDKELYIRQVIGTLLYYARAIDPTILVALSKVASRQSQPTVDLLATTNRILQHVHDHPNVILTFQASDMQLVAHSDASFNSESKARSRTGGFFFFANKSYVPGRTPNGGVLAHTGIIPVVVASASEAEYGALFNNAQLAKPIRNAAQFLGYPQQKTKIICDNESAVGIANGKVKLKRSRSFDLRFHWIKCREAQKHFEITWASGKLNHADFFTKVHPSSHHKKERQIYIKDSS